MSKDITKIVRQSLGLSSTPSKQQSLDESLVADPKPFNLPTEFQSAATKKANFDLYENYIKTFNRVSAELDGADRSKANSNNSQFRSLKLDETYNMNAMFLHELYFANISDMQSKITMDSLSYMRIQRDWGTFDKCTPLCAQSRIHTYIYIYT